MSLSPVGASYLPYLRAEVGWTAPSGLNPRCGRVPRALPWAGIGRPFGAEGIAPSYCTALADSGFLVGLRGAGDVRP